MTEVQKQTPVSIQQLLVSTLAQSDALAKLLIEKGIITLNRSSCKRFPKSGRHINECSIQRSTSGATTRAIKE